ncbi:helicase-related protein [Micromonospora olivasterospora]|uniref:N12 class adenine-specific DNA methylase n=1 Tax=Micromonospora olivasterospora TaxID=1880 RepID=A0A562HUU9_MICOL|nr:helicase-related protein [Micromonospora olivasterospora]TWH62254.1 N12 class adenine-specific DNA methylase [Micromonospora olivasterospora]
MSFTPRGQEDLAPRGEVARLNANLAALRTLRTLEAEDRPATAEEQAVLARWSGWGAVPGVFEGRTEHRDHARFAAAREELRQLLGERGYAAAERNTLNAHYTDAAYVRAIWDAVTGLGFEGGSVLEPGCGPGTFIGLAPDSARMVGVEVEPVTAGIAAALYPHATIRTESFADTRSPAGAFDLTIGNVPFGNFALADRRHNPGKHSIHNHFLIKSLHLTRPGGLVVALTSRYTMDAANPAARREMAALADLVAAVRLPTSAHEHAAGTKVVTDLLILRRREPGREQAGMAWEQTREIDVPGGETVHVNEFFASRPDRILGELSVGRGAYNAQDLLVTGTGDTAADLTRVLGDVVDEARLAGLTLTPRAEAGPAAPVAVLAAVGREEGHIEALDDGTFTTVVAGQVVEHKVPATQADELRALLLLRDTVTALLQAESSSLDDGDEHPGGPPAGSAAFLRIRLNTVYDAYVEQYGYLNRYDTYTRRQRNKATGELETILDEETGQPKLYRNYPQLAGFRGIDPHAATVFALENFNDDTRTATKADIFSKRVILPRAPRLGADSPEDALAICLDDHGAVLLPEIARLLGVDESEAREALGELVYDDPGTGRLVEAAAYLSDNVRAKLDQALVAVEDDPRFEVNVRALQRVLPRDVGPGEIMVSFGAPYIDYQEVQAFLQEILRDPRLRVTHPGGSDWQVKGSRVGVLARSTWGTAGMSAPELAQRLLTKTPIRVFYEIEKGKRALDVEATATAQAKAVELEERFESWVWEEPERAARIAATYNRMFNAHVPRSYVGARRSLPGISVEFRPRPHQIEAVTRIVNEPGVGLFHCVGAGKTAVMAIGAMELKRLGLVNKPAIVVPTHLLEQFCREFLQIYPQARVLAAGQDDTSAARRHRFVARCATGNWDTVIMAASFFETLRLSDDEQRRFLDGELKDLRDKIERAHAQAVDNGEDTGRNAAVKRLQGSLVRKEEKIKEKFDKPTDPGVTFDQTGIDFVFRDEWHDLKNDTITSSIVDASNDGSDRAIDFRAKLDFLRRRYGQRVVCGATATPIANSVRELYVVTRHLRPDLLEATGTMDFDTWASVFGKVVTSVEISPTGSGFQTKSRLAKYTNAAELSLMLRTFGDIRTPEDLNLPTPLLTVNSDGYRAPHVVTIDPAPELVDFIATLDDRVEWCRNHPREREIDNILKISGEARAASLDLRLLGLSQNTPGKIDVAARNIAEIWQAHRDTRYLVDPDAENPVEHETPGALQIVFCDLGTPKPKDPERWTAYEALRDRLVDLGMPREAVKFIHEANSDKEKANLFAACRNGDVSVLIGSTGRMGTGTNIQNRAVALHHLDCPWRPADITQRDGRIMRQGNQNAEVSIYRYVVTGSFDAFSWQTVARKGGFIDQMMRGTVAREIEDVSDETLQAHQIKAIATGNPLLIEKEELGMELARLERANRSHHNTHAALEKQIRELHQWIAVDERRIEALDQTIAQRQDIRGEKFRMTVAGHQLDKRPDAGRALQHAITAASAGLGPTEQRDRVPLAALGGFDVTATIWNGRDGALVSLMVNNDSGMSTKMSLTEATTGDATGLVRRLEHHLASLESRRGQIVANIANQREEIERAHTQLGQPFARHDELIETRRRMRAVSAAVDAIADLDSVPVNTPAEPAVPVSLDDDWMPAQIRESLTDDERTWLTARIDRVANAGTLQAAARAQEDVAAFAVTFDKALTAMLGDPNEPNLSVAIFLKCDDVDWRASMFNAARQAVHDLVRATPAPVAGTAPANPGAARPEPNSGQISPLEPAAIIAVTTPADRSLLDACTRQALRVDAVQAAARAGDETAFTATFASAMTSAIGQLDDAGDVARLADLHGDQAFRQGLTKLVWSKLTPRRAEPPCSADARPVNAAAVAATAFMPATGSGAAAPVSPAPTTTHRAANHDHAHLPER